MSWRCLPVSRRILCSAQHAMQTANVLTSVGNCRYSLCRDATRCWCYSLAINWSAWREGSPAQHAVKSANALSSVGNCRYSQLLGMATKITCTACCAEPVPHSMLTARHGEKDHLHSMLCRTRSAQHAVKSANALSSVGNCRYPQCRHTALWRYYSLATNCSPGDCRH